MTKPPTALLSARALVAGVCLLWSLNAHANTYPELVDAAREQIRTEQFVAGLASAKDAVRANPSDYKGHYYVALALMGLGRFDDAQPEADMALALTPPTARGDVEKLILVIKNRRGFANNLQQAEAAAAEGMMGKAARLYEQAWQAGRDNPEAAFRAADLYATRLDQLVDAGRLLRQVAGSANGPDVQAKANAELGKLSKSLNQIARTQLANARQQQQSGDAAAAIASLQLAEDANPSDVEIHLLRVQIAALGDDFAFMKKAVTGLARQNAAKPVNLAPVPRMLQWLQQPQFAEFMTDLIGPNLAAETKQRIVTINDDWSQYQRRRIVYAEQVAAEENRSRACHASLPPILEQCLKAAPMGGLFGSNEKKEAHKSQCRETHEKSTIECNVQPVMEPQRPAAVPHGARAD